MHSSDGCSCLEGEHGIRIESARQLIEFLFFRQIKEVAPVATKTQRQFWSHDIKVAREYNQTSHRGEDEFTQKLADEITAAANNEQVNFRSDLLRNIGRSSYQNTWSPCSSRTSAFRMREHRPSIADLEKICAHITGSPPQNNRRKHSISFGENWSPPKYRAFEDHIRSGGLRRASMPYPANVGVPPVSGPTVGVFKGKKLDRITEVHNTKESEDASDTSSTANNTRVIIVHSKDKSKSRRTSRKFIVTPATDQLN